MKDTIVIHTLDVPIDWMQGRSVQEKVAEVKRWHIQERGWRDIGYAMVIDRDGSRGKGRDTDKDGDVFDETGAHAKGWNKRSIGIALVGGEGVSKNDPFDKNYTPEQRAALWKTIHEIEARFGAMEIKGHNEVSSKACPGFWVPDFIAEGEAKPAAKAGLIALLIAFIAKLFGGKK